ncbi:MAG TPA: EF-hand domain-containing protein [Thiohalobacter sp.]|nr:EF-hand domain-containing protein [Thiohalobacter sp.]
MPDKTTIKPLVIALSTAVAGSLAGGVSAADNPFTQTELSAGYGYMLAAAEGKCGGKMKDGKCGGMMGKDGMRGPAKFDTNGDGKVTLEEFNTGHAKMFEMLDTNGDGKVTLEEFNARHAKMFEMLDTNGDGVLSGDELRPSGKMRGSRGGPMSNAKPADGADE